MGEYQGSGLIRFEGKPSTRTRLHELAHKNLGHEPGKMTVKELVNRELDAEAWAWEAMDKKPNYKIGLPAYLDLVDRFNFSSCEALGLVSHQLRRRGIEFDTAATNWYLGER